MVWHLTAITIALILDRLIGDPPNWPHPVRWIGSLISWLEKRLNKGSAAKAKGVVHLAIVLSVVGVFVLGLVYVGYEVHWIVGLLVEIVLMTSALASKSLQQAAVEVLEPLKENNLDQARMKLSWIVGRDTDHLTEDEISRGTIETVSENTSDGITAPLFWALIGGAPAIWIYKAINTGDSIVGYKNKRYQNYGWASARLDDVANWIPSRITGYLMLLSKKPVDASRTKLIRQLHTEAKKHPSPNSGWGEAAVALMLQIQLGGKNTYQGIESNRPLIGTKRMSIESGHITQTIQIMNRTVLLFIVCCWIGGIIFEIATTWS